MDSRPAMDALPSLPSASVPTTFPYLQNYARQQNKAIRTLRDSSDADTPLFTECISTAWTAIWEATWNKGEATFQITADVQRDDQPVRIDDSLISDEVQVPDRCNAALKPARLDEVWKFSCASFFIRPEFEEAQLAALSVCAYMEEGSVPYDALVYSGSPGIGLPPQASVAESPLGLILGLGKSVLLLILLLRRLAAGLPTGLQINDQDAILFWEHGILKFGHLNNSASYNFLKGTADPRSRIWMLVDLNRHLTQPAGAFSNSGPFFVVVAASPRPERFEWTKKLGSFFFFYMKPWSFFEVLQARSLIMPRPPSEQALWQLHVDYGPSPRHLFSNAMHPQNYVAEVTAAIRKVPPEKLRILLQSPHLDSEASHFLIQIEPSPTSRYVPQKRIVTTHVFDMFWQRHETDQLYQMAQFYDMCRSDPTTSLIAGMIFECRVHQLLKEKRRISLVPIYGHSAIKNVLYNNYVTKSFFTTTHLQLPGFQEVTLTDGMTLTPDRYYRPQITNFPAIDSLILIKSGWSYTLVMFQITVNKTGHDAKRVGLDKVDRLVVPHGTKKILVAVIPDDVSPTIIVPKDYLTDEILARHGGPDKAFPVFRYQIRREKLFEKT